MKKYRIIKEGSEIKVEQKHWLGYWKRETKTVHYTYDDDITERTFVSVEAAKEWIKEECIISTPPLITIIEEINC